MSFESELHDLLEEAAARFDPDSAVLAEAQRRADAKLRARRWGWGLAAAAVVALIAVVGTSLGRGPSPEPPVIVDQPSPHTTDEPTETDSFQPPGETGPELTLADDGTIHGLTDAPDRGVLVQVDDRVVVLVGLDGVVLGHLKGQLIGQDSSELTGRVMLGLQSVAHLPAVAVEGVGDVWLDPIDSVWKFASYEAPLRGGDRVAYDVDQAADQRMQLYGAGQGPDREVLATWPENTRWWLSNDHRVVTWLSCWDDHECPSAFYDTDMGGRGELDPGCWVANAFGDFSFTEICSGGEVATSFGPERTAYQVPVGTDGTQGKAVAAFNGGFVRIDHSCEIVEPMRIIEGEGLVPLLGGDPASNPSAVPLGTTAGGRVVLHFNAAACDATDPQPGVYIYDPEAGTRELVFEATLHKRFVQMWTPGGAAAIEREASPASQTPSEAARDGVVPAVAALTFDRRVEVQEPSSSSAPITRVETEEGVWVVSRMPRATYDLSDGCGLGVTDDPDALYRRDVICTVEYGEILLLDHDEQRILRAFPLPGVPPTRIAVTDDAVWCARVGDGGLPDSMLCRIDRQTYDWQVRIFASSPDSAFTGQGDARSGLDPETGELWLPEHWVVDRNEVRYGGFWLGARWSFEDGVLVASSQGSLRYDPDTLTPIPPCDLDIHTEASPDGDAITLTTTIATRSDACGFDPNIGWTLLDSNGWPLQLDDRAAGETQLGIEPGEPVQLIARWTNWCADDQTPATVVFRAGPFGQHEDPLDTRPTCESPDQPPTIALNGQP